MRITPLDIRNHSFSRRFSGIDGAEVSSFLHLVSEDYEALVRENESQHERIRQLEQRVEQLVADERLLKETLLSAQAMTTDLREAAIKESEVLVGEAEVKAEKILDAAHRRAAKIGEEIRELRGLRTRLAEAMRATLDAHRGLVDSLEEASHEDLDHGKVTYLARTSAARDAAAGSKEPGDSSERTTG
jgi:cell division initiation protein